MNICFLLLENFHTSSGGVERVTQLLASRFCAVGHRVSFCAMFPAPNGILPAGQFVFPECKINSRANAAFFENFLREQKVDIIIFQGANAKKIPHPQILKKCGVRLFSVWHSEPNYFKKDARLLLARKYHFDEAQTFPLRLRLKCFFREQKIKRIYKYNARYSEKIIVLSESFVPAMKMLVCKQDANKILSIANPSTYSPQDIVFANKKKELLFVGRIEPISKRPDLLLKIWAKLEMRFSDWRLRFVGDGDYLPELKELAKELKVKNVFFEGQMDPEKYYREASILCLTSAFEGFGMVLVEAAAFGCVPVAFDSFSAVRDIIANGENGVIVPAFDLDKYAETLAKLMSDHAWRERLSREALKIADKFSIEKIAGRWGKLF